MNKALQYIGVVFLALLSLFSVLSNSLFHHHEEEHHHHHHHQLSCESEKFPSLVVLNECGHDSHVILEQENCLWCDNYISVTYTLDEVKEETFLPLSTQKNTFHSEGIFSLSLGRLPNKSPPSYYL